MGYDVTIERRGIDAVIDLQGSVSAIANWIGNGLPAFPEQANTATQKDGISLCWIAPERWLLRSAIEQEEQLLALTRLPEAPVDISIVQVSDTLCFFRLTGPDAGAIVSSACPLDHHSSAFPENGISYTSIFGIKGLLARIENGFEIAVESSFADMIEDYLARANA